MPGVRCAIAGTPHGASVAPERFRAEAAEEKRDAEMLRAARASSDMGGSGPNMSKPVLEEGAAACGIDWLGALQRTGVRLGRRRKSRSALIGTRGRTQRRPPARMRKALRRAVGWRGAGVWERGAGLRKPC